MGWFRRKVPNYKLSEAPAQVSVLQRRVADLEAKYDATQTTDANKLHWGQADALSADSANSVAVRKKLRERSRYEVANNTYARGITQTLAMHLVGTGPRLQLALEDPNLNKKIEADWRAHVDAIGFNEKLFTLALARVVDGESFGVMFSNDALDAPVQLDVRLYEAEQFSSSATAQPVGIDGIILDDQGNVTTYHMKKAHPGGPQAGVAFVGETTPLPAKDVIHWFRPERPGQHRGVPAITSALALFALLRRYTLAVVKAAETAASQALVLQAEAPPSGEVQAIEALDAITLEQGMMTTLPMGWKLGQVDGKHPNQQYEAFKHEVLNEIARCVDMPYNIAAANSSGYNFSSGRLDHQTYYNSIRVEQQWFGRIAVDPVFLAWLVEARVTIYSGLSIPVVLPRKWIWDSPVPVDPEKAAKAQKLQLANLTTNLAIEWAKQNRDWEEQLEQIAKERKKMATEGLAFQLIEVEELRQEGGGDGDDAED